MELRVLGPLEVSDRGTPVKLTARSLAILRALGDTANIVRAEAALADGARLQLADAVALIGSELAATA